MTVEQLILMLSHLDKDSEIFIRNSVNPVGNIQSLDQIEESTYGFMGDSIKCLILNTDSSISIEKNDDGYPVQFIKSE